MKMTFALPVRLLIVFAVIASASSARAALIGRWTFDEPASLNPTAPGAAFGGWKTVADSSPNNLTGVFQDISGDGPVVGIPGASPSTGTAAQFDGLDQEVFLGSPAVLQMANDFTITAWINPDDLSGVERIFSQFNAGGIGYGLGVNGSRLRLTTYGVKDYDTAEGMFPAGQWSHVAVTLDTNNDATFYVNGSQVGAQIVGPAPANIGGNNFFIGSLGGRAQTFGGGIDDVQVHSGVLTQSEIQQIYSPVVTGPSVVGHWALDETVNPSGNTVAVDSSGNGFDGIYQPRTGGSGGPIVGQSGALPATATAADFNGASDEIFVGSPPELDNLTNDLTVMAWVKPDALVDGVTQRVFSIDGRGGSGWGFGLRGDELKFTSFAVKDYISTGIDIPVDEYSHIAAVMDSNNDVTFYVNGVQAGSTIVGTAPARAGGTRNWFIGRTGVTEPFGGTIDDVYVFDGALSEEEVLAFATIPEPSTLLLLVMGMGLLLPSARRRVSR